VHLSDIESWNILEGFQTCPAVACNSMVPTVENPRGMLGLVGLIVLLSCCRELHPVVDLRSYAYNYQDFQDTFAPDGTMLLPGDDLRLQVGKWHMTVSLRKASH